MSLEQSQPLEHPPTVLTRGVRTRELQHAAVVDVALAQVAALLLTVSTESISFALTRGVHRYGLEWHVLLARDGDLRTYSFHEIKDNALSWNIL